MNTRTGLANRRTAAAAAPSYGRRRTLVLAAAMVGLVIPLSAARAGEVEVTVEDIRSAEGRLMLQVVRDQRGFEGEDDPALQLVLEPAVPSVRFSTELKPGTYGIRVLQDIDGNGELNENVLGMPTEPWAFSNNAAGNFGPPKWREVRFEVGAGSVAQTIRLNH